MKVCILVHSNYHLPCWFLYFSQILHPKEHHFIYYSHLVSFLLYRISNSLRYHFEIFLFVISRTVNCLVELTHQYFRQGALEHCITELVKHAANQIFLAALNIIILMSETCLNLLIYLDL